MEDLDIKKLEHSFLLVDADNRANLQIIENLRRENEHLRQIVELLITNPKSV